MHLSSWLVCTCSFHCSLPSFQMCVLGGQSRCQNLTPSSVFMIVHDDLPPVVTLWRGLLLNLHMVVKTDLHIHAIIWKQSLAQFSITCRTSCLATSNLGLPQVQCVSPHPSHFAVKLRTIDFAIKMFCYLPPSPIHLHLTPSQGRHYRSSTTVMETGGSLAP